MSRQRALYRLQSRAQRWIQLDLRRQSVKSGLSLAGVIDQFDAQLFRFRKHPARILGFRDLAEAFVERPETGLEAQDGNQLFVHTVKMVGLNANQMGLPQQKARA